MKATTNNVELVATSFNAVVTWSKTFLKGAAAYLKDANDYAGANAHIAESPERYVEAIAHIRAQLASDVALKVKDEDGKDAMVSLRAFQMEQGLKAKTLDDYATRCANAVVAIWNGYKGKNLDAASKEGVQCLGTMGEDGGNVQGYVPSNRANGSGDKAKTISKADLLALVGELKAEASKLADADEVEVRAFVAHVANVSTKQDTK